MTQHKAIAPSEAARPAPRARAELAETGDGPLAELQRLEGASPTTSHLVSLQRLADAMPVQRVSPERSGSGVVQRNDIGLGFTDLGNQTYRQDDVFGKRNDAKGHLAGFRSRSMPRGRAISSRACPRRG